MDQRDVDKLLPRLQRWYSAQCDGEWEHQYGVNVQTLDNPGWLVKIDLVGTALANSQFERVLDGTDEGGITQAREWIHCFVVNGVWQGAGDSNKLARILEEFLSWAERSQPCTPPRR